MIDPDVLKGLRPEDMSRYRYAVIEDEAVRIEEGVLSD